MKQHSGNCQTSFGRPCQRLRRTGAGHRPQARRPGEIPRYQCRECIAKAESGVILREVLSQGQRKKFDEAVDSQFYSFPRLVKHVDDSFLAAVTRLYRNAIPENGHVLDLMSSWVSHLPEDRSYGKVVGHGMNTIELSRNKQLDHFFVRDLNKDPSNWSMADDSFDAVICCVSVQYLQQPEKVFAEIYRVLKPGGVCIISFSNRLYSTKGLEMEDAPCVIQIGFNNKGNAAIQAWRDSPNDYGRIQLVKQYFMCVDGFTLPEALREMPKKVESMGIAGFFEKARSLVQQVQQDPFYAVISYKNQKPKRS